MNFWTQDEFEQFISCMEDKPTSHCGFMILYWTGCRIGELLALTLEDFDEEEKTLRINKSYQRIGNRLGHEKIQTTLSTYSHLYPDQSRKLADQLEKLAEADEN